MWCSILAPNVPSHDGSVKTEGLWTEMEGDIEQGITVGGWETGDSRAETG